jgi:hypothetical protein
MEFLVRGAQLGEPGVCITFEERVEDLIANIASLGFDLPQLIAEKKLGLDHVQLDPSQIEEAGEYDLEGLFVRLGYAIDAIGAQRVLLDTIEALFAGLSNTGILRAESDTPGKAGGLMSRTASKAVGYCERAKNALLHRRLPAPEYRYGLGPIQNRLSRPHTREPRNAPPQNCDLVPRTAGRWQWHFCP